MILEFRIKDAALYSLDFTPDAAPAGPDMLTPQQALRAIGETAHELVHDQYRLLNEMLIPALRDEGIHFVRRSKWSKRQKSWLHDYFHREIVPTLSPISLDPARPLVVPVE